MNLELVYKLPWTKTDNPNGWIEVTTYCQIKCPGCYRGLGEENPHREHASIPQLKSDIDKLVKERNIQTLSIAGGEPLLFPNLSEIVEYAASKGLKIKIFTNGYALTKKRVEDLRDAGVIEFVVHIDKYQQRSDLKRYETLNAFRLKYCEMFRAAGGINLGFILPVSEESMAQLPESLKFFKENTDIISLVVLIPYKDMLPEPKNTFADHKLKSASMADLADLIGKEYGSSPCAYLSKVYDEHAPSWLFSIPLFLDNMIVGHINSDLYRFFQERYHRKKGKYFITTKGNKVKSRSFAPFVFQKSVRDLLSKVGLEKVKNPRLIRTPLRYQVVLLIDPPDKTAKGWNLCEGCPDAMIHEGKLVPSCLLERIKQGESIVV